ncbi:MULTISPECIES: DUF4846 domain-containing protein [Chitinophaga]|nr:DUF4846 domain-containing protein [Chitinophaga chungangae]
MFLTALYIVSLTTGAIAAPQGFQRIPQPQGSFGEWLRNTSLKPNNTVYLFNGRPKNNQQAQYAVLDIPVGKRDLQQCADAVMRLYAEFRFSKGEYGHIVFHATDGTLMDYEGWRKGDRFVLSGNRLVRKCSAAACNTRACFEQYLETVFAYAGTLSLERELKPATEINPGDVFIQGGSPGHAVIVMDVAQNAGGQRVFLLAQSYMPAQDIHILKNPASSSPWYGNTPQQALQTPEWDFPAGSLRRFK